MWWRKPSLLLFQQNRILKQSTKHRYHKHPKKKSLPQEKDTLNSIDKSSSTQITNVSNRITIMGKPTEIDIVKDNKYLSNFLVQEDDMAGITPYILRIPRKNKINKTLYTYIIIKEPIQEPVNPRKSSKQDTIADVEKYSLKETPPYFRHKVYYGGDTNEKTRGSDDSPTEADDCVIKKNMKMKMTNN